MMDMNDARIEGAVLESLRAQGFAHKHEDLSALVHEMIEANLSYMWRANVWRDGAAGTGYYDDDDAFDFLSDRIVDAHKAQDEKEIALVELVDAFLDAFQDALEELGLIDWN